jgi:membrane associated rhomboid family serine protease
MYSLMAANLAVFFMWSVATVSEEADLDQDDDRTTMQAQGPGEMPSLLDLSRHASTAPSSLESFPTVDFMHDHFSASLKNLREGRVHSLLFAGFSHQTPQHLLGNMFALYLLGFRTYHACGPRLFAGLYMTGATLASLGHCVENALRGHVVPMPRSHQLRALRERLRRQVKVELTASGTIRPGQNNEQIINAEAEARLRRIVSRCDVPSIGASGAVMATSAVTALLFPFDKCIARGLILEMPYALSLYVGSDLMGIVAPSGSDRVDHAAHLAGAAAGVAFVMVRLRLRNASLMRHGLPTEVTPFSRWFREWRTSVAQMVVGPRYRSG